MPILNPKIAPVRRACLHCHTDHKRCDTERPCSRCVARGLECIEQTGKRKRKDDDESLEERAAKKGVMMMSFRFNESTSTKKPSKKRARSSSIRKPSLSASTQQSPQRNHASIASTSQNQSPPSAQQQHMISDEKSAPSSNGTVGNNNNNTPQGFNSRQYQGAPFLSSQQMQASNSFPYPRFPQHSSFQEATRATTLPPMSTDLPYANYLSTSNALYTQQHQTPFPHYSNLPSSFPTSNNSSQNRDSSSTPSPESTDTTLNPVRERFPSLNAQYSTFGRGGNNPQVFTSYQQAASRLYASAEASLYTLPNFGMHSTFENHRSLINAMKQFKTQYPNHDSTSSPPPSGGTSKNDTRFEDVTDFNGQQNQSGSSPQSEQVNFQRQNLDSVYSTGSGSSADRPLTPKHRILLQDPKFMEAFNDPNIAVMIVSKQRLASIYEDPENLSKSFFCNAAYASLLQVPIEQLTDANFSHANLGVYRYCKALQHNKQIRDNHSFLLAEGVKELGFKIVLQTRTGHVNCQCTVHMNYDTYCWISFEKVDHLDDEMIADGRIIQEANHRFSSPDEFFDFYNNWSTPNLKQLASESEVSHQSTEFQ